MPPDARLYSNNVSYNHVHNEHLELMQDAGILGYLVLLVLFLYLGYRLIRLNLDSGMEPWKKRLALGVAGAMAGFFLHGLVSVAQRMMVVNLPFFLALTLGLFLVGRQRIEKTGPRSPALNAGLWASVLILALATCIPWANKQHTHYEGMKIRQLNPGNAGTERLIEHVKSSSDVYALFDALKGSLELHDPVAGLAIYKDIQQMIPNYRESGFFAAAFYALEGDFEKAREQIDAFLKYDAYNMDARALQAALGVHFADPLTFQRSFENAMLQTLLNAPLYDHLRPENLKPSWSGQINGLMTIVEPESGKLVYQIHPAWAQALYNLFKGILSGNTTNQLGDAPKLTKNAIEQSPFFSLPFRDSIKEDETARLKAAGLYKERQRVKKRLAELEPNLGMRPKNKDVKQLLERLREEVKEERKHLRQLEQAMRRYLDPETLTNSERIAHSIMAFVTKVDIYVNLVQTHAPKQEKSLN